MGGRHPRIDRVVLIRQEDDSECLLRDERDVGSETVRRTGLVDQNVLPRLQRRINLDHRIGLVDYLGGVPGKQVLQVDRVGILLPDQILRHLADPEVSGVRVGDRMLQLLIKVEHPHVRLDEVDHVVGCGPDAVSFRREDSGRHPNRLVLLSVALRVVFPLSFGDVEIDAVHSQRGEKLTLHKGDEILVHALRRDHAKHPDARIGVGPIRPWSVGRFPVPEILHQLVVVRNFVRNLQRETTRRMRPKV